MWQKKHLGHWQGENDLYKKQKFAFEKKQRLELFAKAIAFSMRKFLKG